MESSSMLKNNGKGFYRGDNLFENYKHIISEIERKDSKIAILDQDINNIKFAIISVYLPSLSHRLFLFHNQSILIDCLAIRNKNRAVFTIEFLA